MRKRRKLIINGRYQISFAAKTAIAILFVIGGFIAPVAYINSDNNEKLAIIRKDQNILAFNQNEVLKTLAAIARHQENSNKSGKDDTDESSIHISTAMIEKDIEATTRRANEISALINEIFTRSKYLVRGFCICTLILTILLFWLFIKRTGRISGSMFLLNRHITDIRNGKKPNMRPLRANDDFKEVFDNFYAMVQELEKKRSR